MKVFKGYRVTSSNGSAKQRGAVRVYGLDGERIGEVFISTNNGFQYLRDRKKSKHLSSLFEQCCITGDMPAGLFNQIFECNLSEND